MTGTILSAFGPVFAIIAAGYLIRASGLMPRMLWTGVNALNHRVLLPAFLFALLARASVFTPDALKLTLASALASSTMIGLGLLVAALLRSAPGERAALVAVAALWNFVLTLALADRLLGADATATGAAMVVAGVSLGTACAVVLFAVAAPSRSSPALTTIIRDPVLIACGLGLVASAFGLAERMPGLVGPLEMVGSGSIAVILLAMGAGLDFAALKGRVKALIAAAALRTLAGPIVFLGVALLFGFSGDAAVLLALAGAAPGAALIYAVAADFKGETELVAGMITLSVLMSAAILPFAAAAAMSL